MTNRRFCSLLRRGLSLATMTLLLSVAIAPPSQAWRLRRYHDRSDPRYFQNCARDLLENGIPAEQVAAACADALVPTDLSACVSDIARRTPVEANLALFACFRSRRPLELANCTIDITRETLDPFYRNDSVELAATARDALERCRRSLLPQRYAACVVGLSRPMTLTPLDIMSACLDAEDFPRELYTPTSGTAF